MRLDELYQFNQPDISIELFPPKTEKGDKQLFETVESLKALNPAFFSMTYGAAGSTRDRTLDLCNQLKNESGVETMCHLTVVGQSKDQVQSNLKRLKEMGIYNVLALRGDPPAGDSSFQPHPDGFGASVELIETAKADPWFSVAASGFPEVHPEAKDRASDIAYAKRKVEAGAAVIITQLFFDNAHYFSYVEALRKAGVTVPVVPGILPILSVPQVRRFTELCKTSIPSDVEVALQKHAHDDEGATQYGIELATRQCEGLLKAKAPGIHFYALNKTHSVETILHNLGMAH